LTDSPRILLSPSQADTKNASSFLDTFAAWRTWELSMHLQRLFRFALVAMFLVGLLTPAPADELTDAKAALEKAGVRVLSTGLLLPGEGELSKELGKSTLLRRNLTTTQKDLQAAEQQLENGQKFLSQLKVQHMQLSAQLANINPNDVALNNKLVGALNAIKGQHDLGREQEAKFEEQVQAVRAKADEAREAYIQFVLDSRELAGKIEAEYAAKAADSEVKASLAKLNQAAKKNFALAPTASFQASLRRLKQLEETVLSESINLRDDGSDTLRVSVVVDGKYQQEMVLDSGASLISLPAAVATKLGLKPGAKDPAITLQLADGSEIEGRLMKLSSVRVGKFSVNNVECAVLDAKAINAEPLLGMSFLKNFKFEIDSAAKTLNMVKVIGAEATTTRAK
jgi:clan AA aspartic protease (TIGR02281 family)